MRKAPAILVILAVASPMLGGCKSLFGQPTAIRSSESGMQQRDSAGYAEAQMALGKESLDSGQYGLAIIAFRNARVFPDHAAGAYNGLAVAYLQLDRPDLAERFFKQAVAEAPGNKRFQANLALFYKAVPEVAVRTTRDEAPALPSLALNEPASAPRAVQLMARAGEHRAVTVQAATGHLVRVSANQLLIGGSTLRAPSFDGRRRSPNVATMAARQPVRRVNPQYPKRFAIAAPGPTQATAGSSYPVRVRFTAASLPAPAIRMNEVVTSPRR